MSASDPAVGRADPGPAPSAILNQLVLALLARTLQPPQDRPARIGRLVVAEKPADAAAILDQPELFAKNFALVAAFGPSRFNLNGPEWEALRPRTQRAYARAGRPLAQAGIAATYAEELAAAAPGAAGLEHALARAALRVFFAAFGLDLEVTPFLAPFAAMRRVAAQLQALSWTGGAPQAQAAVTGQAAAARQAFAAAAAAQPAVSALIDRLAREAPPLPIPVMLADLMTNMFAGIETTTASLAWMIDCLGRNGDLQAALRDEAAAGGMALRAGFRDECLRLFPPIPFVVRQATRPVALAGQRLAPGDLVLLSLIGLHRDPSAFAAAQEFHAARAEFAPGAAASPAFRPFLSGPRACGGRRLAQIELDVALGLLLRGFRFDSPSADPAFDYALAFRPRLGAGHRVQRA